MCAPHERRRAHTFEKRCLPATRSDPISRASDKIDSLICPMSEQFCFFFIVRATRTHVSTHTFHSDFLPSESPYVEHLIFGSYFVYVNAKRMSDCRFCVCYVTVVGKRVQRSPRERIASARTVVVRKIVEIP